MVTRRPVSEQPVLYGPERNLYGAEVIDVRNADELPGARRPDLCPLMVAHGLDIEDLKRVVRHEPVLQCSQPNDQNDRGDQY